MAPVLIYKFVTPSNQTFFGILGFILNIVVGGSFLLLARRKLRKLSKKHDIESESNREVEHKKRILISNLKEFDSIIGNRAFDLNTQKYIGRISEIDIQNKKCKIKTDFDNEYFSSFDEVLVNLQN